MSCESCKRCQELDVYTYIRVGSGNVRISGCGDHLRELIERNRAAPEFGR